MSVEVGKLCGESGSTQEKQKFFPRGKWERTKAASGNKENFLPRGSWERANAKLAEQGRELPLPWDAERLKQRCARDEADSRPHAENKFRRKAASLNDAQDVVHCEPAAQHAHEAQKTNVTRADAALAAVEAEKQQRKLERVRKEKLEAEEKVMKWCKWNGFQDMHTQKKTFMGATKFPLHTAVKYNDREIINMMLLAGVKTNVMDSKMQTPRELAIKISKDGSHNEIILMLL